jgi:outer membrane protein assembly factor BamB
MDVAGGVKALDAKTGKLVWKSAAAAKPLGLSDSHLIVQLESGKEPALKLGSLDARTGQSIASASARLPSDVVPSIVPNLKGTFSAIAHNLPNGEAVVSWQYVQRTPRSLPPGTESNLPPKQGMAPPPAASQQLATRGAVRFNPSTGALGEVEAENLASVPTSQTTLSELPGTAEGRQFLSVDGRNYLVSSRTERTSETNKYTLTVYDRQTDARLGQFKSSVAAAPFYVTGSKVIYEIGPSVTRTSTGLSEQPRRIEGVDLASGKEIWSTPIRDATYRGPFPP